jgi:hypothetical protein
MVFFWVGWEKNRILNHLSQNIVGDEHTTANAFAHIVPTFELPRSNTIIHSAFEAFLIHSRTAEIFYIQLGCQQPGSFFFSVIK